MAIGALHRRWGALSRSTTARGRARGLANLGLHHHHADHPVGLVLREVADERERPGLVERERRRPHAEWRERDLIRTVAVHGLRPRAVTRVERIVADQPFMVDGVVVD